jgi:hypothetical protein
MKYSLYRSIELELEEALREQSIPVDLPAPLLQPNHMPPDIPVDKLTRMSYLLKFSKGGYYSHLQPDNRYK